MKLRAYALMATFVLCSAPLLSSPPSDNHQEMRDALKNLIVDNHIFYVTHKEDPCYFEWLQKQQKPRITVVGCSDSRIDASTFDLHPMRDVFFIRNIGNQLGTCLGSLDYGIHHVRHPGGTPLLLVLGHSKCGAITAATKGSEEIDKLEESIQRELKPLLPGLIHKDVSDPTDQQVMENVIANVHYQVGEACQKYRDQIERQELWVVGAVYDFTPEGKGQIKLIQVNHQTNPEFIKDFKADVMENGNYCRDPGREHPCHPSKK